MKYNFKNHRQPQSITNENSAVFVLTWVLYDAIIFK